MNDYPIGSLIAYNGFTWSVIGAWGDLRKIQVIQSLSDKSVYPKSPRNVPVWQLNQQHSETTPDRP